MRILVLLLRRVIGGPFLDSRSEARVG